MASTTEHFGLQRLNAGDQLSHSGYKFTDADRVQIDRILWAFASHGHEGGTTASPNPVSPPTLSQSATGGSIPAGTRVRYVFTLVDSTGNETAASPEAFVDTPSALASPAPPSLVVATTGGTLDPGQYFYAVSAYKTTSTSETRASTAASAVVPAGTSTNKITLTLGTLPAGATGFNIYRLKPGGSRYLHIGSTTGGTFVDNGAVVEDCDRSLPQINTTNSSNSVTVTYPGATPVIPAGMTWKIYRTYAVGNWTNSLLHWVVEQTTETSGIVRTSYTDIGSPTSVGQPPATNQQMTFAPRPIALTSGPQPVVLTFAFVGATTTGTGTNVWVCEFPHAVVCWVRAALGRGYAPVGVNLVVDVNKGSGTNPTYTTIFTDQTQRPKILPGNQIGARAAPAVSTLVAGDSLCVDVDAVQADAGTRDLTIHIAVLGYFTAPNGEAWS